MRKSLPLLGAMLLWLISAYAQTKTITGQVKNNAGEPLSFATIKIKGSESGTIADANGYFKFDAAKGTVLVISSAGYEEISITIGDNSVIHPILSAGANLNEVVVTALGIKRNKNDLPYAAQLIKPDEITKTRTGNFVNSLSGKVAGLQIKANNNMGGSTDIILRGTKSITGDNQALIVIDGIPVNNSNANSTDQTNGRGGFDYGNNAADINPDDVESINVLKGAAATALYGSRASNGVILITTKKAKKGLGIVLNLGGSTGTMDRSTWIRYQHEYGAGYFDPTSYNYSASPPSTNPRFAYFDANGDGIKDLVVPTTEDASFGAKFDPKLNVYQWTAFDPTSPNYLKPTPWVAAKNDPTTFFENPLATNASIFLTGGGDITSFKLGYTRNEDKGILPNSKLTKNLINFSADYKITSKLTAMGMVNFSNIKGLGRYGTGYGDANSLSSHFREWWQMNVDIKDLKDAYFRTGKNITWNMKDPPGDLNPIYWDNPYFSRYKSYQNDERNRYLSSLSLNYNTNDWLNILARVSLDSYDQLQEERNGFNSINIASYSRSNQTYRELNYDLLANINKDLSKNLNFKGLLGGNLRKNYFKSVFAQTNGGLILPNKYDLANSVNPITPPLETDQSSEVGGVFAGATFVYKNMLTLDATARNDKSSTLPAGNNSYFYPSVSGSFIFSKLLPNFHWLSFGKLRLNYAEVGKDAPFDYITDSYFQPTPFGSIPLFSVDNVKKNPILKPERTRSAEAGIELSFLKNRIGLDFTYYKTNTIDEIIPVTTTASTGYTTQIINAGNVENKGIELSLNLVPVKTNNFIWTTTINWTRNRNKVISLTSSSKNILLGSFQGGVTLNAVEGQPFGVLRGSDFVYTNGMKTVDANGYYIITQVTNIPIGNIQPDWIGGINNSFKYKSMALSFLIDVKKGGSIFSIDQWYGQGTGLTANTVGLNSKGNPVRDLVANGGGVLFPGVTEDGKTNTKYAQLTGLFGYGYNNFPNAGYIYDASYVKLRELNLTYSIPAKSISKFGIIKGIDISIFGRNLWLIHKNLPDADPEDGLSSGNIQGFQVGAYPTYRTLGFNLKFQF